MILESLAKEFIQGIVQMAHLCSAISGVSGVRAGPRAPWRRRVLSPPALSWRVRVYMHLGSSSCEEGRCAPRGWGELHLPADRWRVTLFGGNPREDVKQNNPFLCGWLCLFASSPEASCR